MEMMPIPRDPIKYDDQKPKVDEKPCKENPTIIEVNGIGNLPRDLIIEILSRLPIKALCKFRCVSKHWFQLLSGDKHFISLHGQQSKTNPFLLFRKYNPSSQVLKKEMNDGVVVELTSTNMKGHAVNKIRATVGGPVNTFTSCGPLVLLCCPYRIYVCNPGTEQFIRVPVSQSVSRYCTVGFGLCSLPNYEVFKIVHLFPKDSLVGDEGMGCQVLSLTDGKDVNLGSWRRTGDCPFSIQTHGLSVCVGGFIYWMVSDEANDLNNKSILSFDLETEQFESIHYPKLYSGFEHNLLFLTGFKKHLCLVESCARTSVTNIWMLRDREMNIWMKECSFSLSSGLEAAGCNIKISGIVPSGHDDGEIVINTERHGLLHYDVEKELFTRIEMDTEERYKLPCLYYEGFFALHV